MRAEARAKCCTALTNAAWDHVSGETESGSPVYGCTCSASTPERSALRRHHSRSARGRSRSSSERAVAMYHSVSQSVLMNHGFPGTFTPSCETWK